MTGPPANERIAYDAYYTPPWCVRALLAHWEPGRVVWEPAAGDGSIVKVLVDGQRSVVCTDIQVDGLDFLQITRPFAPVIVTNPPYTLAEKFLRHALAILPPNGRVAMLFRNEFDSAATRRDIFELPAFIMKVVLLTRPRWIAGTDGSPRHNFSWFVFDKSNGTRSPTLRYISRGDV